MGRRPSGTVHHSDKKVLSMYRWPTHSGLRKPDYWHQQEVLVARMTTQWLTSMAFTKRR